MPSFPAVTVKGGPEDVRPLHLASKYNCSPAVTYLLGQGADVNAPDVKGRTPLHYATRRGHEKIAKVNVVLRAHSTVPLQEG